MMQTLDSSAIGPLACEALIAVRAGGRCEKVKRVNEALFGLARIWRLWGSGQEHSCDTIPSRTRYECGDRWTRGDPNTAPKGPERYVSKKIEFKGW